MFVERLRQFTLLLGTVAAFGLAEQHHEPGPVIAELPFADTRLWTGLFIVCGVMTLTAAAVWPRCPKLQRCTAVVFATVLAARAIAIGVEYGTDLWGTVAQILLTSALIVSSWSWTGETIRKLP